MMSTAALGRLSTQTLARLRSRSGQSLLIAALIAAAGFAALPADARAQLRVPPPPGTQPEPGAPKPPPANALPATLAPAIAEKTFPVGGFVVGYGPEIEGHPDLPSIPELMGATRARLLSTPNGFTADDRDTRSGVYGINDLAMIMAQDGAKPFTRLALEAVLNGVRQTLNRRGIVGVWIELGQDEIEVQEDGQWVDLRPADRPLLTIVVHAAKIGAVRTVTKGPDGVEVIDSPADARIRAGSPISPQGADGQGNLLNRDAIDSYVLKLNRRSSRRVDAAVGPGEEPGTANLDYLISRTDPLTLYAQVSNTGTAQTEEWRERLGLIHNDLTGRDDVLALDYVTAGFQKAHSINGSYELPFFEIDGVRFKAFGGYSRYEASDVGFAGAAFSGESYNFGAELVFNVAQWGPSFLDLTAGARFQNVSVNNRAFDIRGDSDFVLPRFSAVFERLTQTAVSNALVAVEFNLPDSAGTAKNLDPLGRTNANREFAILSWSFEQSAYLEPLIDSEAFNAGQSTLAHELGFTFRGQSSLDRRVVPNFQQTTGGFYSVRGYEESEAVGDTAIVFSAEYRLHIPRLFTPSEQVVELFGPFRPFPGANYQRPDWDLIFRTFYDVGRTMVANRLSFEQDHTLSSVGVGIEFQLRRNLNIRLDYGVALEDGPLTQSGDGRAHFLATFLF